MMAPRLATLLAMLVGGVPSLACGGSGASDEAGGATAGTPGAGGVHSGGVGAEACPADAVRCPMGCVNVLTHPGNCGACGVTCGTGQVCTQGTCACATGLTACGTECVDLLADGGNCGACVQPCPSGTFCSAGACADTCAAGRTACGNSCVDVTSSLLNCGACGAPCASGQSCAAGACGCPAGQTACAALCVDLGGEGTHCGACDNVCPAGAACVGGVCGGGTGGAGTGGTATGGAGSGGAGGAVEVPDPPELVWVDGSCGGATGGLSFETAEFCVSLSPISQTVTALRPKVAPDFDFTPGDLAARRSGPGYFALGDLTLRWRSDQMGAWQNTTTSASRTPVTAEAVAGEVLAGADLGPALPAGFPFSVTRRWVTDRGRLAMRFELRNTSSTNVEVGALGLPMVFNNVITGRSLEEAHARCSFADPYVGRDAGYLQVTRLSGRGPALLVLPDPQSPFEGYNPILNPPDEDSKDPVAIFTDLTPRNQTFEGFYEWMVHTKAYAENEWSGAQPWNLATSAGLAPGESRTYGVTFVLAPEIRQLEATLARDERPVAVGIPGYVLPSDLEARLYLRYAAPVTSSSVEPPGALSLSALAPTASGWQAYDVRGNTRGRARLTLTYGDGTVQTVHYYVTKPARQVSAAVGQFLTTTAWYDAPGDPFGRSPSVMTYDHELGASVTQCKQAWVAGLGDDGGATWLAGAMKLLGLPVADEVSKYERFVDGVVWGNLQYASGALAYGVKRTLFYYEPTLLPSGYYDTSVDWTYWGAWRRNHTLEVPRSYNYPHVAALYWVMYRLARNQVGLVTNHPWDWYLERAYRTGVAMTTIGNDYAEYGLMDGTVFLEILRDLQREGWSEEASDLETRMRARADVWRTQEYPFGSEMAWDSTGQEEVYAWTRYFGDTSKARVCVDAVTGYMPAVPHWGYNGCARRYWDFVYGGSKTDRLERMIHHYGSSLNALPVLTEYRDHPDDLHLLRIGYAGMMGTLSNIQEDGFPSMAFHAFPDTLSWDPISGDVGLAYFGHAFNTATYLLDHPDYGWQAFGGNVAVSAGTVLLTPLDSFRKRVYIAPLGLWLTLEAGQFASVTFDTVSRGVHVVLDAADAYTPSARLRVEQPAAIAGVGSYTPTSTFGLERGAYVVPLGASTTAIDLSAR